MPVESNGLIVGRYRIEGKLGQGGMGAVYRAFDLHLELPCALKQLGLAHLPTEEVTRRQRTAGKPRLTREVAAEQFRQEARLLARLEHPGLPRVTDCFAVGDDHYLVMTLVEGEDLEEALARAATGFPEPEVLAWVVQVMDALDYCHAQGVIHRDVKPANIIVTAAGKVYLVDFGIAKLAGLTQLTPIGARAATTGYSPIEQYTGHEHTGVCSDIYALGATMYALLTGQAPRAAGLRVAGGDMPSPRALAPGVSVKMDAVVMRALAIRPAERFQSVAEMRGALPVAIAGRDAPLDRLIVELDAAQRERAWARLQILLSEITRRVAVDKP